MSTVRNKMSCTVMYQPYAMSSYSTCDRPAAEKKSFRFPYVPSPPDSLHSDGSSYSSPGPSSGGTTSSATSQPSLSLTPRRPLTPSCGIVPGGGLSLSSSAPATITSSSQLLLQQERSPPSAHHHHHSHHTSTTNRHSHSLGGGNVNADLQQQQQRTSSSATSSVASQSHNNILDEDDNTAASNSENNMSSGVGGGGGNSGGASNRAQYVSANCIVYENYRGETARVVEEHFNRALGASSTKISPMAARNFPPSFWNSNYQPTSKPFVSYGASEFYGAAVDYGPSLSGLSHHHQADPWHYPLTSHQGYHHRPTDLSYPPMPSTSRFNAAQYGSFFLAGAAATSSAAAASRFAANLPGSSQCGVKGESGWPSGLYHHPHDSLSELNLAAAADYAAAHYSNRTAGLETTVVGQDASAKDPYWF